MGEITKYLAAVTKTPTDATTFAEWITQNDTQDFFKLNLSASEVVLFVNVPSFFLTSAMVPLADIEKDSSADLLNWRADPYSSWSLWWPMSKKDDFTLAAPMSRDDSKTLHNAEQIVFRRDFAGHDLDEGHYTEISQKMTHLLDLHYVKSRNAYCRLNRLGDLEDVIRIIEVPEERDYSGGTIVTITKEAIENYMVITASRLVLMFDITRCQIKNFSGWTSPRKEQELGLPEGQSRLTIDYHGSYQRGYQVVSPVTPYHEVAARIRGEETTPKQYATFIIQDWKNKRLIDYSCDPKGLGNYFVKSDLPFETSPTFFRPEVLLRYKADPVKYQLNERSISCRGGWSLQTYDINEETGQVHTYAIYLSRLPYEEQTYWKSFNEEPKGPISKRAFTNDFEGQIDDTYNPLSHVKRIVRELGEQHAEWWTLRNDTLPDKLNYPVTGAVAEWISELIVLNQVLIEGLEESWLRKKAGTLNRKPEQQWRSIKLLEECLEGLDFDQEHTKQITAPLRELQNLRNKLGGTHASGTDAKALRQGALNEHGTLQRHFSNLCGRCAESFDIIRTKIIK
jgi:hypothetical protein